MNTHLFTTFPPALLRIAAGILLILGTIAPANADTVLLPAGSTWKYLDDGSNQTATGWQQSAFDDAVWVSGLAELGYGDGDEVTVVEDNPTPGYTAGATNRYITTYFRKSFTVANPADFIAISVRLLRDDGAVVYLNGTELRRDNMPAGPVTYSTLASSSLAAPAEATFYETFHDPGLLVPGMNFIAVEIHQSAANSSDISFNLALTGVTQPSVTRGPYLQKAAPDAVTVRWRTNVASDSRVNFGTNVTTLDQRVDDATSTTEHEVRLTGLAAATPYFYDIGSTAAVIASGADFAFTTPPPAGSQGAIRIWVVGDSGTANGNADAVRDAFVAFNGAQHVDAWLMLGDNAYNSGTDLEYQAAVFDMYPELLRKMLLWSTIGNHETNQSQSTSLLFPYLDIFSLPTAGEGGGVPSGTEKYYGFDYGPVHFICLDAMTSSRSTTGAMAQWLRADLEATTQKWIVAFWHHPPYTKGSHDSDTESQLIQMRERFVPILEAGGVDLVLCGHSHQYERSKLINGHYGLSGTLTAGMVLDAGSGQETGSGAYHKPVLASSANQGAVYVVAGSSGQVSAWTGGSTATVNPTPHPVMFASLRRLGSVVLDVNGDRLDVKFIGSTAATEDTFTILKDIPNQPPSVTITAPAEGTVFAEHANIAVTANPQDLDGTIEQADFYADNTLIGSVTGPPFSVTWNDVAVGNYALTVTVTDNLGASTTSPAVNISVIVPPPPPLAPAGVIASGGDAQATVAWNASSSATSYTLKRATASGGPYSVLASGITATSYADGPLAAGIYYYVVSASNFGGESPNSAAASATVFVTATAAATGGAVSGEPVGTVFKTFGVTGINDAGQLAFLTSLSTGTAIVAGSPPVVIVRKGADAPGLVGAVFTSLKDPLLNNNGAVAFLAKISGGGVPTTQDDGIWTNRGGSLAAAAREGAEPPGVPGGQWKAFTSVVLGNDLLAFTASMLTGPSGTAGPGGVLTTDDTGLWIADAATTTLALREGQSLTLTAGTKTVKSLVALQPGNIGRGHGYRGAFPEVLARVTFTDGKQALVAASATGLTEIAANGGDAPGYAAGSKLLSFGVPTPTDDGSTFLGNLQSGTGNVTSTNSAAIFVQDGTGIVPIVSKGANAPGLEPGVTFSAFKDPVAGSGLRTAWVGTVKGGTATSINDQGIWWRDGSGALALVAREGTAAPGVGTPADPGLFYSFKSLALPAGGAPLFTAALKVGASGAPGPGGALSTSDLGLWSVDSTGAPMLLLRESQSLAGKTLKTFTALTAITGSRAQTRSFNNAGHVVVRVYLTDNTQAVMTIELP